MYIFTETLYLFPMADWLFAQNIDVALYLEISQETTDIDSFVNIPK